MTLLFISQYVLNVSSIDVYTHDIHLFTIVAEMLTVPRVGDCFDHVRVGLYNLTNTAHDIQKGTKGTVYHIAHTCIYLACVQETRACVGLLHIH